MTQGSTPTTPKRRRTVDLTRSHSVASAAKCTKGEDGQHPDPTPTDLDMPLACPACFPSSYARRHARHRGDSFGYATTEAHGVTR